MKRMTEHGAPTGMAMGRQTLDPERLLAVERVVRALVAHEMRRRRDDPEVQDAVQETLRIAIDALPRFRRGADLQPWVLGIARKVSAHALRRLRRRGSHMELSDETLACGDADPHERALARELWPRLDAALASLPASWRRAVLMFHVEGLSYAQIAASLEVPQGTIATWLARARATLARELDESDRKDVQ